MNCRIKNIKPPCGYSVDGIASVKLLDFDDFDGLRFENDGLYDNNLVTAVFHDSQFTELDAPDSAKYNSTLQNGIYTHTLETFIGQLSAETLANLHLSTKRRYFVLFQTRSGRYFCFGYAAGAQVSYTNQTTEGTGSIVTVTAQSIYPLFEVAADALNPIPYEIIFVPDFEHFKCEAQ